MEIAKKEWKKLICQPALIGLLLIFIVFNGVNIWLTFSYSGLVDELKEYHKMILAEKEKKTEDSQSLQIYAQYKTDADSVKALYDNLDIIAIKEEKQSLSNYYPTGSFQRFIDNNYEKLQKRIEQIKQTKEGESGFYHGVAYQIHSTLYGDILKPIILEMVVMMSLSVLLLMDYERIHKTKDIVTVTKTGRNIVLIQATVGISTGVLCGVILLVMALLLFFSQVSFAGLWDVPVSASMMAEPRIVWYYPYITFWKISVLEYLLLSLVVIIVIAVLCGIFTVVLQLLLQNGYLVFVLQCLLMVGTYVSIFEKTQTWLDVLICMNPVCLWLTCGAWFMENDITLSFTGSEFYSIGLTTVGGIVLLIISWRRYRIRDIR